MSSSQQGTQRVCARGHDVSGSNCWGPAAEGQRLTLTTGILQDPQDKSRITGIQRDLFLVALWVGDHMSRTFRQRCVVMVRTST